MPWIGEKADFIDLVYLTGIFFHQKKKTADFLKICIAFSMSSRYFTLAFPSKCLYDCSIVFLLYSCTGEVTANGAFSKTIVS